MVLLPWMAVLIANDRPAKTKAERATPTPRANQPVAVEREAADEAARRTIDGDI